MYACHSAMTSLELYSIDLHHSAEALPYHYFIGGSSPMNQL